jgi:hypothetical protein
VKLSPTQKMQVRADHTQETITNREALSRFVAGVKYPLYFLDFETTNPAVPMFINTRPFQQICFQYSLHWVTEELGPLTPEELVQHREFLADGSCCDPRPALIYQLIQDLGSEGSILVYTGDFIAVKRGEDCYWYS